MAIDALSTNLQLMKNTALDQFYKRQSQAELQIDNADLVAGSPMYFYCKHCAVQTDVLDEQYLFIARTICSQCKGMSEQGWLPKK